MMNKNKIFFTTLLFLLIPFVSSLSVVPFHMSINKMYNQPFFINLTLTNNNNLNFSNIFLETNPYVSLVTKNISISKNTSKNITLKIFSNDDFSKGIRIKGFYNTTIGESHSIFHSTITYPNPPTICSKNAYKGDKIDFHNSNDYLITLQKTDGTTIGIINPNSYFNWSLTNSGIVNYIILRQGYPFGGTCTVDVMNTNGLINNPDFDAVFNLSVNNVYVNTTINMNVPISSYNLSLTNSQQGLLSITNTGNNVAHNVSLKANWFSFSENNFNINSGQTKVISYTINALGHLTHTNQTNKTYIQNLTLFGNFGKIVKPFSIFVEYGQVSIGQGNSTSDFLQWLKQNYPQLLKPKVVIQYVNNNSRDYNITTNNQKLNGLASAIFSTQDSVRKSFQNNLEILAEMNKSINKSDYLNLQNRKDINQLLSQSKNKSDYTYGILFLIIFIIIVILGGIILKNVYKYKEMKKYERWDANAR